MTRINMRASAWSASAWTESQKRVAKVNKVSRPSYRAYVPNRATFWFSANTDDSAAEASKATIGMSRGVLLMTHVPVAAIRATNSTSKTTTSNRASSSFGKTYESYVSGE